MVRKSVAAFEFMETVASPSLKDQRGFQILETMDFYFLYHFFKTSGRSS